MAAPITSTAAIPALSTAWDAAKAHPELQGQRFAAHRYSDDLTVFLLMERGRQAFNGLAVGLEDGQIYTAKGAAPKRARGVAAMAAGLLQPAKTLRRGMPLPGRNILNPADAEWATITALMTGGTFEEVAIA